MDGWMDHGYIDEWMGGQISGQIDRAKLAISEHR